MAIDMFKSMNKAAQDALLETHRVKTPFKALKRATSTSKLAGKSKSSKMLILVTTLMQAFRFPLTMKMKKNLVAQLVIYVAMARVSPK